eukprot:TRINITY_DN60175_c0_g1_i1.p1 TRINITY_DN60175_c0_g1~~TRINITY_DN60175_c0_g1_i1.p1  ORF type:complete len:208 (+),score=19.79 TRINITY_DN60175_c0_g1_i1:103-726(+)
MSRQQRVPKPVASMGRRRRQTELAGPNIAQTTLVSTSFVNLLGALSTQKLTSHRQDVSNLMFKKQLMTWLCFVRVQRESPSALPREACCVIEAFVGDAWKSLGCDAEAMKTTTAAATLRLRTEMDGLVENYVHKFVTEHVLPRASKAHHNLQWTPISNEVLNAIAAFSNTVRDNCSSSKILQKKFTDMGYAVNVQYQSNSTTITLSW